MAIICFIADTHRQHHELNIPACDILIHCGDMCSFRQHDEQTLADIDDWFAEQPASGVLCVAGNHDFQLESGGFEFKNAQLLTDRMVDIDGIKIYGSPWCPDLSGFAFYQDDAGLAEKWREVPTGIDVLVTHTPPAGILDLSTSARHHLGCALLRSELERIRPQVHAFGHIHASYGRYQEGQTLYLNAAVVRGRQMSVSNPPMLCEISGRS